MPPVVWLPRAMVTRSGRPPLLGGSGEGQARVRQKPPSRPSVTDGGNGGKTGNLGSRLIRPRVRMPIEMDVRAPGSPQFEEADVMSRPATTRILA